ncbi:hypothetical protein [Caballeronia telluris]|uniref:Uncharacterized protein n=1 Tax=Caballeronia telluris TaxID=326475 RepID=A0A158IXD1_9BURK|nr:hypothetical protein [Caballeronia telluris]SAL60779.1 hypothetical protein AWB66_03491 [Caballeronia telluris]
MPIHYLRRLTARNRTAWLAGAFGFRHAGFVASVPFATILVVFAVASVLDDLRGRSMRA